MSDKQIESIKKALKKKSWTSFSMTRVPKPTINEFIKFANEQFGEDYGQCFKYCFDVATIFFPRFSMIEERLLRIEKFLSAPPEKKETTVKMIGGNKKKVN